ncbi:MAG TPA: DNA recombination protein RmuC [Burkholderiales bacterium]|nr:DNA recombination protein RmuC [Burkholderiales bacterium]
MAVRTIARGAVLVDAELRSEAALGRQLYERIAKLGEHWATLGDRLDKAVDAYNSATATLESRVLVSARRFRDLKAGSEDVEIETIEPVERTIRALQAPELSSIRPNGNER